jgi:hypothetical protein
MMTVSCGMTDLARSLQSKPRSPEAVAHLPSRRTDLGVRSFAQLYPLVAGVPATSTAGRRRCVWASARTTCARALELRPPVSVEGFDR